MTDLLAYLVPTLVVLGGLGYAGFAHKRRSSSSSATDAPATTDTTDERTGRDSARQQGASTDDDGTEQAVDQNQKSPLAPVHGRMARLRHRLASSGSPLGQRLLVMLSQDHIADSDWDDIEDLLLMADLGVGPATELIDALRTRVRVEAIKDPVALRALVREELLTLVDPTGPLTSPRHFSEHTPARSSRHCRCRSQRHRENHNNWETHPRPCRGRQRRALGGR